MPRETKADRILAEAKERVDVARKHVNEFRESFRIAGARLEAYQATYDALVAALAPKPRKKADPKPAAVKEVKADAVSRGLCSYKYPEGSVCLALADNAIHDKSMGYSGYHPFVSAVSSVRTVKRRSSRTTDSSKAAGASAVSSETEMGAASAVAGGLGNHA